MKPMNIYAEKGYKVIVTEKSARQGMAHDKTNVEKYLSINSVYTVASADVGGWNTNIILLEVPDVEFNSVNFEEYIEDS
ncbi:hypothetical protein ACFL08_04760 [Patescibacteria group bacterium]